MPCGCRAGSQQRDKPRIFAWRRISRAHAEPPCASTAERAPQVSDEAHSTRADAKPPICSSPRGRSRRPDGFSGIGSTPRAPSATALLGPKAILPLDLADRTVAKARWVGSRPACNWFAVPPSYPEVVASSRRSFQLEILGVPLPFRVLGVHSLEFLAHNRRD